MGDLRFLLVGLGSCLLAIPLGGGEEPVLLSVGSRLERQLVGGGVEVFRVDLLADHVLRGAVEQRGIDVLVRVLGPDGALLAEIDSPNGTEGPEPIDVTARVAGKHTIEIRALEPKAKQAPFEVRIERILTPAERAAEVAAELEQRAEVISWLGKNVVRLAGVDAGAGFEDLAPLRDVIGKARVVALGEATHGTREFFKLKHRMLEFLVAEMGFTAFGIEATLPEAFDVDHWVLTGEGDPEKALAGLYFWTWNTEEVMDLLDWMRAWNADSRHARKVRFYGFDMQFAPRAAKVALEALTGVDPKGGASLRVRLAQTTSAFNGQDLGWLPEANRAALLQAARELETGLRAREAALRAREGRERASRILRCARVLVQCVEMYSHEPESYALRDPAMAENALWALEQEGPDGKIVLWAHNGHVATQEGAMGALLRKALGDDLRVLGFAFSEGSFQAVRWPPPKFGLTTFVVPPATEGSLDAALAATGLEVGALDLRGLPRQGPVAEWFQGSRGSRSIGAAYAPESPGQYWDALPVVGRYDGILFVRRTSAARPMPSAANRPFTPLKEPSNLDFERGEAGSLPAGWRATPSFGYRVEAGVERTGGGSRVVCIAGLPDRRYGEMVGRVSQFLEAGAYRSRRLRLRGSVRTEGAIEAHLTVVTRTAWFSTTPNGSVAASGRPNWTPLSAEVDVPEDATSIAVELAAEGIGRACFDDLVLEDVGRGGPPTRP